VEASGDGDRGGDGRNCQTAETNAQASGSPIWQKDLRIAAEVAGELGLDLPELALARARLDDPRARFGDDRDYGVVARLSGW
jgi:hypothetical protein